MIMRSPCLSFIEVFTKAGKHEQFLSDSAIVFAAKYKLLCYLFTYKREGDLVLNSLEKCFQNDLMHIINCTELLVKYWIELKKRHVSPYVLLTSVKLVSKGFNR